MFHFVDVQYNISHATKLPNIATLPIFDLLQHLNIQFDINTLLKGNAQENCPLLLCDLQMSRHEKRLGHAVNDCINFDTLRKFYDWSTEFLYNIY